MSDSTSLNCTDSQPALRSIATTSSFISTQPSSPTWMAFRRNVLSEKVKRPFARSASIVATSSASASLSSGMPPETKFVRSLFNRRSRFVRSADRSPRRRSVSGSVEKRIFVESSS